MHIFNIDNFDMLRICIKVIITIKLDKSKKMQEMDYLNINLVNGVPAGILIYNLSTGEK